MTPGRRGSRRRRPRAHAAAAAGGKANGNATGGNGTGRTGICGRDAVVAFTLGAPAPGQLGVADGVLTDRAFCPPGEATALAQVSDVRPAAPHNVANALAAAALARAYGVAPAAVRAGLRAFEPEPHRISLVGRVSGVDYVDDSKATNPHAAAASLAAYPKVVWIAGGLLKGAEVDGLVSSAAGRLRAVVLLGTDRAKIRQALARHAPNVPVTEVGGTDTGVMDHVVTEAAALARPGDTVLLAPAAASLDMFANYGARGDAFAAAVHKLAAAAAAAVQRAAAAARPQSRRAMTSAADGGSAGTAVAQPARETGRAPWLRPRCSRGRAGCSPARSPPTTSSSASARCCSRSGSSWSFPLHRSRCCRRATRRSSSSRSSCSVSRSGCR